jgi:hypothetical protein
MLKLRDRVVLETSIRDAKGEFDAPIGYTEGFDQTTVSTDLREGRPEILSPQGLLVRADIAKQQVPRVPTAPSCPVPEGTAPRVRPDLLPARQALPYCFREPCAKSSCVFRALKAHNDRGHHTD